MARRQPRGGEANPERTAEQRSTNRHEAARTHRSGAQTGTEREQQRRPIRVRDEVLSNRPLRSCQRNKRRSAGEPLAKLPKSRRTERAAVNALRSLLERHDHIVQAIDGGNDLGEDLYLDFTSDGQRTGDTVKIQVKGGRSHRAVGGYRVRIGNHESDWTDGNVPVLCVIHDLDSGMLYWANATKQIRLARRERRVIRSIFVSGDALLDEKTIASFATTVRSYTSRYKGNRVIESQLGEMAGVSFDPTDRIEHFRNDYGEDLIFRQRLGEPYATLLHSDLDWHPQQINPMMLDLDGLRGLAEGPRVTPATARSLRGVPTIGEVILTVAEAFWLIACFAATEWMRNEGVATDADLV